MGGINHQVQRKNPLIRLGKLLFFWCCVLAVTHAAEWHVETVPDTTGGRFSSLKLDRYGNAHVVHQEGAEKMLRYSFWDRKLNKWFSTNLERASGYCTLTLDSKQRPHISYPGATGVVHTYWDGEQWQKRFVDAHSRQVDYYTSIALDLKDNPSISFYEEVGASGTIGHLRILSWNGTYWSLKTVDADTGSGKFNSMNSNSKGYPEIAYANVEYGNLNVSLRYARWNGQRWETEILERTGTSKWSVSMVLDANDVPHIAYTEVSQHLVKYVTRKNGKWEFQTVDSIASHAYPDRNGIALDAEGNPYISYYDAGAGVLKVAHRVAGRWVAEVVDQDFAGYTSSIQIGNDTIYLTYGDENGQWLRFARRPINPTTSAAKLAEKQK